MAVEAIQGVVVNISQACGCSGEYGMGSHIAQTIGTHDTSSEIMNFEMNLVYDLYAIEYCGRCFGQPTGSIFEFRICYINIGLNVFCDLRKE